MAELGRSRGKAGSDMPRSSEEEMPLSKLQAQMDAGQMALGRGHTQWPTVPCLSASAHFLLLATSKGRLSGNVTVPCFTRIWCQTLDLSLLFHYKICNIKGQPGSQEGPMRTGGGSPTHPTKPHRQKLPGS